MSTFPQRKSDYAASLIKELIYLIEEYDNESHSYIISTLLTAVLMYHLSWVQTVAPPDEVRVKFILWIIDLVLGLVLVLNTCIELIHTP